MTPESKPSVEGKKNEKKVGWALLMVMIIRPGLEKPDNKAGRVIRHQGICRRKFEPFKTIHASKIRGNVVEVSFRSRIRRKARNFAEFRRQVFALLLHNTVSVTGNLLLQPVKLSAYCLTL